MLDLGAAHRALGRGIEAARELDLAHRTFRALDVPRYVERTRRLAADLAREGTAPST